MNAAVKATESEGNAAEATSSDKVPKDFRCEICDFKSNRETGLRIHMSRKHATIEQVDGNTSLPLEDQQFDEDTVRLALWNKWNTTFRLDTL